MTWELFAAIINGICLGSAIILLGGIIYVYITNHRRKK